MTTTLADRNYVDEALAALDQCKTDADLASWNDRWASNEIYIHLPDALLSRLESGHEARLMEIEAEALK